MYKIVKLENGNPEFNVSIELGPKDERCLESLVEGDYERREVTVLGGPSAGSQGYLDLSASGYEFEYAGKVFEVELRNCKNWAVRCYTNIEIGISLKSD